MKPRRPKWLKDVRQLGWPISVNYLDCGCTSPECGCNPDWNYPGARQHSRDLAGRASVQFGIPKGYIQDRLHDGTVINIKVSHDRLYLEVADFEYMELAYSLMQRLGREPRVPDMPVAYVFEKCDFVATYDVHESGRLLPAHPGRIERSARTFLFTSVIEVTRVLPQN